MTKKISLISIVIVALLLSMTLMVNAADQPDKKTLKKITKLMKKGNKYAEKDQLDKAFESFKKVLELSTEYAPVYFEMARLYDKQQKFEMAIENLEKSIKIQPDSIPAINMLTKSLIGMGEQLASKRQIEKSNQYFLKVLEIPGIKSTANEQLNHAIFQLGFNYSRLKNPAKSNEFLLKLLESPGLETSDKDKYVKASYQVGANYFNLKEFEKSGEILSKVIEIDGLKTEFLQVYSLSHFLAGLNASQLKKYKESNAYFIEYLDVTQNNPSDPYRATVNYALGTNNYEMLQKEVTVIKNDKKKDMRKRIAQLAKESKNIQPYITKALELNPNLEPAYMILGNYYFLCLDYENAMQTYRTLIEKFPNSQEINTYKTFLKDIEKESKLKKE